MSTKGREHTHTSESAIESDFKGGLHNIFKLSLSAKESIQKAIAEKDGNLLIVVHPYFPTRHYSHEEIRMIFRKGLTKYHLELRMVLDSIAHGKLPSVVLFAESLDRISELERLVRHLNPNVPILYYPTIFAEKPGQGRSFPAVPNGVKTLHEHDDMMRSANYPQVQDSTWGYLRNILLELGVKNITVIGTERERCVKSVVVNMRKGFETVLGQETFSPYNNDWMW